MNRGETVWVEKKFIKNFYLIFKIIDYNDIIFLMIENIWKIFFFFRKAYCCHMAFVRIEEKYLEILELTT